jgi:hypothetical protein
MTTRAEGTSFEHQVDPGHPFSFHLPATNTSPALRFVLDTTACTNPRCDCDDIDLHLWLVDKESYISGPPHWRVRTSASTSEYWLQPGVPAPPRWPELEAALRERHGTFQNRLVRLRRQGEPDTETLRDAMTSGALTLHHEAFPYDWDIIVEVQGEQYWLMDYHCPHCDCGTVPVYLGCLHTGAGWHGIVELRTGRARPDRRKPEYDTLPQAAITALQDAKLLDRLRSRGRQVRRAAAKLRPPMPATRPAARTTAAAGRNQPCPCGSGRKFKRCCGAVVHA